jgi:hypothetical protein
MTTPTPATDTAFAPPPEGARFRYEGQSPYEPGETYNPETRVYTSTPVDAYVSPNRIDRILDDIQAGSWAIVVVCGVLLWLCRIPLKAYITAQTATLTQVGDNSHAIKDLATLAKAAETAYTQQTLDDTARHAEILERLSGINKDLEAIKAILEQEPPF